MELREAFEAADTDKGGALELEEVKFSRLVELYITDFSHLVY